MLFSDEARSTRGDSDTDEGVGQRHIRSQHSHSNYSQRTYQKKGGCRPVIVGTDPTTTSDIQTIL